VPPQLTHERLADRPDVHVRRRSIAGTIWRDGSDNLFADHIQLFTPT